MTKLDIQEDLVKLYLRLNGYLTSGLIIHSPVYGKNQTELDILGIRFPFHNQNDREIGCSEYLQIPTNTIDVIIGEVKSGKEKIQFNSALREDKGAIEKLVNWLGCFNGKERTTVVDTLQNALTPLLINVPKTFTCVSYKGEIGSFSIRPIIFSVDRGVPAKNQPRYVYGQLMLDFIWDCLRPTQARQDCSTIYNLNMWGHSFLPLIEYFKDENKQKISNMKDYYKHFGFS